MQLGNAWANRPRQCKTAQLTGEGEAHRIWGNKKTTDK